MSVQYWVMRYWTSKERRFQADNRHITLINFLPMPTGLHESRGDSKQYPLGHTQERNWT